MPIGIQSFEDLRTTGYKYVDKTERMYQLTNYSKHVFLSRPRRFGKSLLVSSLEAYFLGKRELFKGLAVESLEKEWIEYPILHLDLNSGEYKEDANLGFVLNDTLLQWESVYGTRESEVTPSLRFKGIIRRAYEKTGKKVVVLVDEYDKPLISTITDKELQEKHRTTLKDFYSVMKTCDEYIRFSLLTGVTKFSKVSIFSDLNNFKDVSRLVQFYDICGITESELRGELLPEVEQMSEELSCSVEEAFGLLKENYDGYRFTEKKIRDGQNIDGVYNPYSLLNALCDKELKSYWFETGTPTFLVEKICTERYEPKDIDGIVVSDSVMSVANKDDLTLVQYLFQTGYLTIKDYDQRLKRYTLGYPNKEVKEGFLNCLASYYTKPSTLESEFDIGNFVVSLEEGNVEEFIFRLQAFMASIPYEMIPNSERHVQNVMYLLSTLCGFYCEVESHTNKGRIDLTIKTPEYIYVIELKYDCSAQDALDQIKEKGYAEPFATDSREVICLGINYSSTERNISEWVVG